MPFGSSVERADGKGGSIVGDDGQVYLAGLPPTGDLAVRWGAGTRQACRARYQLPTNSGKTVSYVNAECQ
ncbi:FimD/PapC C-terminal domain-containing protein [Pseudomonas brenneri]|uniref:FimD/PapC C-terminal domain-containing protein n=1 Tax=Pseudomonas brenneri TaxID=129817 RepID=UPI0018D3F951